MGLLYGVSPLVTPLREEGCIRSGGIWVDSLSMYGKHGGTPVCWIAPVLSPDVAHWVAERCGDPFDAGLGRLSEILKGVECQVMANPKFLPMDWVGDLMEWNLHYGVGLTRVDMTKSSVLRSGIFCCPELLVGYWNLVGNLFPQGGQCHKCGVVPNSGCRVQRCSIWKDLGSSWCSVAFPPGFGNNSTSVDVVNGCSMALVTLYVLASWVDCQFLKCWMQTLFHAARAQSRLPDGGGLRY